MSTTQAPSPNHIELLRQYSEAEAPRVESDLEAERLMQARLFGVPDELIMAPAVAICSVWPEPLDSQPFHHGGMGRKIYSINAGSPVNPAYCIVRNTWDWTITQEGQAERGDRQSPIWAAHIASDIIRYWTGDHPGNRRGKKGVGIVRGAWQGERFFATPAEIADLVKVQNGFLTYLVEKADNLWDSGDPTNRARVAESKEYRKALRMLGLDINQHPWYRSKVQLYNDCPWCSQKVMINAIKCQTCHDSIVDYFVERGLVPDKEQWPRVYVEVERITNSGEGTPRKHKGKQVE